MMAQTPTDTEPLYSALGADPELSDIVEMFVEEMPERVSKLLEQLETADWEELRRTAHQLKGAAGSYGFSAITPLAAKVEDDILSEEPEEQIRRSVDALLELCNRVRPGAPS